MGGMGVGRTSSQVIDGLQDRIAQLPSDLELGSETGVGRRLPFMSQPAILVYFCHRQTP